MDPGPEGEQTMPTTILRWLLMIAIGGLLAACTDESEEEPTATPTAQPLVIVVPTVTPIPLAAVDATTAPTITAIVDTIDATTAPTITAIVDSASLPTSTVETQVEASADHSHHTAITATVAGPTATATVEPTTTPTPTVPPPTLVPTATTAPTATATDTPTTVPTSTPTAIPTNTPTAIPTNTPTAIPTPARVALLRFADNEYARAGDFALIAANLPPAPAGSHYDLWLTREGQPRFRLGSLPAPGPQVNFAESTDQNLLSIYEGALITLEPDLNTPGEMGPPVFQGVLPADARQHILAIADRFDANPAGQGFLIGALGQWELARGHADLLRAALAGDDLTEAYRHAEHVINILNGEAAPRFGDLDGDGVPQNPGDGVGVVGYLNGTKAQTDLAARTPDTTAEIQLHAGHVVISSDNVLSWLTDASDAALRVIASDSVAEAQPHADSLMTQLDLAHTGIDADGDGLIVPIPGEGGLLTAYEHTLNMGTIELYPLANDLPTATATTARVALPTPTSTPTTADTPSPTPVATATPVAVSPTPVPTPQVVEIGMLDFEFAPPQVTVKVGDTVTWVNQGQRPHSATADDGGFDTGLFGEGESASVTFATTGTFQYFCQLHGGSGGQGMAGIVVVTE
jgi:plastocyanin